MPQCTIVNFISHFSVKVKGIEQICNIKTDVMTRGTIFSFFKLSTDKEEAYKFDMWFISPYELMEKYPFREETNLGYRDYEKEVDKQELKEIIKPYKDEIANHGKSRINKSFSYPKDLEKLLDSKEVFEKIQIWLFEYETGGED